MIVMKPFPFSFKVDWELPLRKDILSVWDSITWSMI